LVVEKLKQAYLRGRIQGLRASQERRLEVLLKRRHPAESRADQATLELLASESLALKQSLHMIIDPRGLCRLLWVGSLDHAGQLLSHIPEVRRRKGRDWRLISCSMQCLLKDLGPSQQESVVGLDLSPVFWLRFCPLQDASGILSASLWVIDRNERTGWSLLEKSDLAALCHGHHQMTEVDQATSIPIDDISERILLLTLTSQDSTRSERDLAELEGLVRSAGATPVAVARQKLGTFNPQTIWGTGKLQEVALEVRREKASLVITDRELTPGQARNLERLLTCPVMDRSELILDIFAQRASSATGRLQVELAQLRYRKSRLVGRGKSLSRQGGGIGTRGPGETQLEKDRRLVVSRIERLGRQLSELKKHRSRIRNRRKNLPRIALVGYTNAGKSSLLNALCGLSAQSEVLAENKLFATLDPTTRRLIVPQVGSAPRELLITDTVGFIRELPAPLMEAFSATLEETLEADCLLLLVDLSNPDWSSQLATVNQVLDSLGANVNRQIVANKIDCCDSRSLEAIRSLDQNVIYVSATSGAGLQGLKLWLQEQFWDNCSASSLVPDTTNQYE